DGSREIAGHVELADGGPAERRAVLIRRVAKLTLRDEGSVRLERGDEAVVASRAGHGPAAEIDRTGERPRDGDATGRAVDGDVGDLLNTGVAPRSVPERCDGNRVRRSGECHRAQSEYDGHGGSHGVRHSCQRALRHFSITSL